MAAAQLPEVLNQSINRCASALADVPRLKVEVQNLKATGEGLAHFASALFELELARRGDVESRQHLSHLAEVLLVFWRDGSGDALAQLHPAMQSLWSSIAPMLVQFEHRQFDQQLLKLWSVREQPNLLLPLVQHLAPVGQQRVEFARCLYHLELARQAVDSSRGEFAKRVSLLSEAYQDEALATELVGSDAGLKHLWGEVKPYLDEFFEGLEEQAQRQEPTRKVQMPVRPPEDALPPAQMAVNDERALGAEREVPSFRTLTRGKLPPPAPAIAPGVAPTLYPQKSPQPPARQPLAPPPPPDNLTPPGGWVPDADVVIEEEAAPERPPPPPPPPSIQPVVMPPPPPKTASGEVEIVETVDAIDDIAVDLPPPPPAVTPSHGLAAVEAVEIDELEVEEEFVPDDATLAFWEYTFAALQAVPDGQGRTRMLASESRGDRKRLTTWLDGMNPHLAVPEGKAFAALVRLMLVAQTKEKSLFGAPNPRRKEGLEQAFELLQANPVAAGHASVWFELDGMETRTALYQGLELLMAFLAFCGRHHLDPLAPASIQKYVAS